MGKGRRREERKGGEKRRIYSSIKATFKKSPCKKLVAFPYSAKQLPEKVIKKINKVII